MARHSRKRRGDPAPDPGAPVAPGPAPGPVHRAPPPAGRPVARVSAARGRSEQRNAEARATLVPLAPGERPAAVTVAALVAAALALANLIAFLAGAKVHGQSAGTGAVAFSALMLTAAVGMWRARYWAVLGFEALLALIVLVFSLLLLRAANLEAAVLALAVVGLGGWLFWKLVRAMARIQMPRRPVGPEDSGGR